MSHPTHSPLSELANLLTDVWRASCPRVKNSLKVSKNSKSGNASGFYTEHFLALRTSRTRLFAFARRTLSNSSSSRNLRNCNRHVLPGCFYGTPNLCQSQRFGDTMSHHGVPVIECLSNSRIIRCQARHSSHGSRISSLQNNLRTSDSIIRSGRVDGSDTTATEPDR